jgi:hypothetical protein
MSNSQPNRRRRLLLRLWANIYFSEMRNEIGAFSLLESGGVDSRGEPIVVCIVDRGVLALVADNDVPDRHLVSRQLSVPEALLPQIVLVRQDQRPAVFSRNLSGMPWSFRIGSTDDAGAIRHLREAISEGAKTTQIEVNAYQPKRVIEALNEMHQAQVLEQSVRGLLSVIDR